MKVYSYTLVRKPANAPETARGEVAGRWQFPEKVRVKTLKEDLVFSSDTEASSYAAETILQENEPQDYRYALIRGDGKIVTLGTAISDEEAQRLREKGVEYQKKMEVIDRAAQPLPPHKQERLL